MFYVKNMRNYFYLVRIFFF